VLFKAFQVAVWYNLSHVTLAEVMYNRASFRRLQAQPRARDQGSEGRTGTLVDVTEFALASIKSDDEVRWAGRRRSKFVHGDTTRVVTTQAAGPVRSRRDLGRKRS